MTAYLKTSNPLISRLLGRTQSLFAEDLNLRTADLKEVIEGRKLMIAGAAGSIGLAFVKQVLLFRPAAVYLIDPDENGLVEAIRDLRSSSIVMPNEFYSFSIGIGSDEFESFVQNQSTCDYFINFAALKHVRSERDPYSLLRMIYTNLRALRDVLLMSPTLGFRHMFSVSSDKAVNPANLMGATKLLMEKLLWSYGDCINVSTARFANVAFSAGSLLDGFEQRLKKNQPLAGPKDIMRYFISHEEAGQLCLLACFLSSNRQVFIPKMTCDEHLKSFQDIAVEYLNYNNFEPKFCSSEEEAKEVLVGDNNEWPIYFSKSDTSGEKFIETFAEDDIKVDYKKFKAIGLINADPIERSFLDEFFYEIEELRASGSLTLNTIVDIVERAVPEFDHVKRSRNLDQKM